MNNDCIVTIKSPLLTELIRAVMELQEQVQALNKRVESLENSRSWRAY